MEKDAVIIGVAVFMRSANAFYGILRNDAVCGNYYYAAAAQSSASFSAKNRRTDATTKSLSRFRRTH